MARPKSFEPAQCLGSAAETFARHGYQGTSLGMLIAAMSIGRQSIYDTYGDKKRLLVAAINHAAQSFPGRNALLASERSGREAIVGFFAAVLGECGDPGHPGCLVSNLLLEQGLSDPGIRDECIVKWSGTRELIRKICVRGLSDGSITSSLSPSVMADALMTLMGGLRISARAGTSLNALKKTVEATLSALLDKPH